MHQVCCHGQFRRLKRSFARDSSTVAAVRDVVGASRNLLRRCASGTRGLNKFLTPTNDNLLTQIKDDFTEGKDLVVSVIYAMREEPICALCMRAAWVMAELALIEGDFQELSLQQ
uniref:Translation initiation factor 5A C-terminal domain-containing protein n=1 Tax=Vitis vinifera TaxID=29760 RepID=F6H2L9_VITVI